MVHVRSLVSAPDGAVRIVKRNRRSSSNRNRHSLGDVPAGYRPADDSPPVPSGGQDYALPPGAAPRS